jgi:hypothetical protein
MRGRGGCSRISGGEVAERPIAPVLKTGEVRASAGSNPGRFPYGMQRNGHWLATTNDLLAAHVGAEDGRNDYRAIGLLEVLQDGDDGAG